MGLCEKPVFLEFLEELFGVILICTSVADMTFAVQDERKVEVSQIGFCHSFKFDQKLAKVNFTLENNISLKGSNWIFKPKKTFSLVYKIVDGLQEMPQD